MFLPEMDRIVRSVFRIDSGEVSFRCSWTTLAARVRGAQAKLVREDPGRQFALHMGTTQDQPLRVAANSQGRPRQPAARRFESQSPRQSFYPTKNARVQGILRVLNRTRWRTLRTDRPRRNCPNPMRSVRWGQASSSNSTHMFFSGRASSGAACCGRRVFGLPTPQSQRAPEKLQQRRNLHRHGRPTSTELERQTDVGPSDSYGTAAEYGGEP